MLSLAINYEEQLQKKLRNTWMKEEFKFYHPNWFNTHEIKENTWDKIQFVSINSRSNILGYIGYDIDRVTNNVTNLYAINFSKISKDNNYTFEFAKDLKKVVDDIFVKFNFNKLNFCVVVGNPVESSYDKIINKFGGRIVGTYKNHIKLFDNKYYDEKIYEITRLEYLEYKNNYKNYKNKTKKSNLTENNNEIIKNVKYTLNINNMNGNTYDEKYTNLAKTINELINACYKNFNISITLDKYTYGKIHDLINKNNLCYYYINNGLVAEEVIVEKCLKNSLNHENLYKLLW